jgi:hypothetical protein
MKYLAFILIFFSTLAFANNGKHYELAKQFDELSGAQDKTKLVDSILPSLIMVMPELNGNENIIREHLISILSSQEYQDGKIKVYTSIYNEKQLESLIELAKSPAFKLLQDHRYEMNMGFVKSMNEIIQRRMPELKAKVNNQKK